MTATSTLPSDAASAALPDSASLIIEACEIVKSYRRGATEMPVLRGVSLRVQRGECVFLIGPSGSGKSTLLSILGCILKPDSGRLAILGEEVRPGDLLALRRNKIGFVFQGFRLVRGLSALDNVCVPAMIRGDDASASQSNAERLLTDVGLSDSIHANVDKLSAGQCQRVALARALANDPNLILADEPTAALDAQTGRQVMRILRQLIAVRGKTAIIVTHDPHIVEGGDQVYLLEEGRLVRRRTHQTP